MDGAQKIKERLRMQQIDAEATVEGLLPAWNDGAAKKSILEFVANVTKMEGPEFVPLRERIAVFDNDGTLWAEQPIYFQASSPSTASRP